VPRGTPLTNLQRPRACEARGSNRENEDAAQLSYEHRVNDVSGVDASGTVTTQSDGNRGVLNLLQAHASDHRLGTVARALHSFSEFHCQRVFHLW